jgi:hypothetical protein
MPLPVVLLGPATAAAAKAVAYECLPAVSSALVGSILVKSAWNRLPEWIREDIAFHNNNNNHHHRESSLSSERNIERLSTVWEKIQAWLESASEPLKTPVPHLWAALLIYCQLCSQLGDDATPCDEEKAKGASAKNGTASSGPNGAVDFVQLKEMLNLATWAYYLDNETWNGKLWPEKGVYPDSAWLSRILLGRK